MGKRQQSSVSRGSVAAGQRKAGAPDAATLKLQEQERTALQIIKWLAMGLLIVDHVSMALLGNYLPGRMIGRLSFPLFAYMIAVGMRYTSKREKYLLRIFCFALISEVPFDLVIYNSFYDPHSSNVLFTFFFAMSAVYLAGKCKGAWYAWLGFGGLAAFLGYFFTTDYGMFGVLGVIAMYVGMYGLKGDKLRPVTGQLAGSLVIAIGCAYQHYLFAVLAGKHVMWMFNIQLLSVFSFFIMLLSKGGKASFTAKDKKYGKLWYLVYPVQFVIIYLIKQLM